MEDEKLLLAEYKRYSDSFWKNEEVGEKRVNFLITLTTAIIAGIIVLITKNTCMESDVRPIATLALCGLFLFGLVTYFRIIQRNRVTDEYKEIIDYLREQLKNKSKDLAGYKPPLGTKDTKRFRGGLVETVAVVNSFIMAVIAAMWFNKGWEWLLQPIAFLILFTLQAKYAKNAREKK